MDEAVRGYIEKQIDNAMREEVFQYVEWVQNEIPISSLRDSMIGYLVGALQVLAESSALFVMRRRGRTTEEEDREIRLIIKRRLPEIVEKIERELNR